MRTGRRAASAALLAAAAGLTHANPAVDGGRRLFNGDDALVARTAGQADALPPAASRCINCHAPDARKGSSLGPRLDTRQLMQPRARRGGPPSRYDAASFCRTLRDGIDPAQVVLPAAMPRYTISDAGCRLLWAYLTVELQ